MGAFEDFVNANLGIRKPIITDSGLPSASSKAAGIIGSHYVDSDTNFLYEKTGENNATDWVKIGEVGQPRGQSPKGIDGSVQFNSGESFAGSPDLTYDYAESLLSGESGRFDYIHVGYITGQTGHFEEEMIVGNPNLPTSEDVFVVDDGDIKAAGSADFSGPLKAPTGYLNELIVSGDAHISGDFYVSGTTYINEVVDTTVSGTVSGYTGVFDVLSGQKGTFNESLTISGQPVVTGSRDYPVLTGVEFNSSTNIMSFFRDMGASNIEIDLSSLAGAASAVSTQWFEDTGGNEYSIRNDSVDTTNPAVQLWEKDGTDSYMPRSSPYSSTTESAKYFEDDGSGDLNPTLN